MRYPVDSKANQATGQRVVDEFTPAEVQMLKDWAAGDERIQDIDSPAKMALLAKVNDLHERNQYGDLLDIRYGTPVTDLRESVKHDDPDPVPLSPLERIRS